MSSIFILLPFVLMVALLTSVVKLAAFLLRRSRVSWWHSFLYVGILLLLTLAFTLTRMAVDLAIPLAVSLILGVALQLCIGSLFFAKHGMHTDGTALGLIGGAQLTAVFISTVGSLALVLSFLSQLLLRHAT